MIKNASSQYQLDFDRIMQTTDAEELDEKFTARVFGLRLCGYERCEEVERN